MKILKKIIWFFIFVIIAIVALVLVFKGVLKFEFKDSIKFNNINYASTNKDVCLSFSDNGYKLDNCSGGATDFPFDSTKGCTMHYSNAFSSIIFDCGLKNINVVKMQETSFNKIKFTNKDKDYVLINNSTFSTMEGQQKITFNFVDEKNIKFSKYIDNNLVDEEVCGYKYSTDESMGLECSRFYGYSAFKIEKYDKNKLIIINRGSKITFTLSD